MKEARFPHPSPVLGRPRLLPVFLPHAGCPDGGVCVFCDQRAQTGRHGLESLDARYTALERDLASLAEQDAGPLEIGFYGGSFTALPGEWPERFLTLAGRFRERGLIADVRCSTRPDACDPARLASLRAMGLSLVELGIQSFADEALDACRRGYDSATAEVGCRAVTGAGLALGVQLMPGLPGGDLASFLADVDRTATLGAAVARLHPCLVLANTPLAQRFAAGTYRPWSLDKALVACGMAVQRLWQAGTAVIRLGLSPEPSLLAAVKAGPWHPAFGQRVKSRALLMHVTARHLELGGGPGELLVPRRHLSEIYGWKSETRQRHERLGLCIRVHDESFFLLRVR